MTKSRLVQVAVLTMILAVVCSAADVSGKWKATFEGGMGPGGDIIFTFKQEGDKLTGSVAGGPGGEEMAIADGKIEGDKITFAVSFMDMKIVHEGTVSGDQIKLTTKGGPGGDGSMAMTLKKI